MKNLLYISLLIMLFLSCRNSKEVNISVENIITEKNDTLPKTGKKFTINGVNMFFRLNDTIIDGVPDIFSVELKEYRTNRILLKFEDILHHTSFDVNITDNFEDVNFDGYKDYHFTSGQGMNSLTHFYLFNKETKVFEYADELTVSHIEYIDSINKELIMRNHYRFGTDSIIRSFDKLGKVKFTEIYSDYEVEQDTTWATFKKYQKIVNQEVIEEKIDSIIKKWD